MEAPPDAPIAGHTQGDNIGQRARQQAKAAHVNRPCEQYRRRDIVEQQNSRGHITDHLRQANSSKPQSTAGEGPHPLSTQCSAGSWVSRWTSINITINTSNSDQSTWTITARASTGKPSSTSASPTGPDSSPAPSETPHTVPDSSRRAWVAMTAPCRCSGN